MSLHSLMSQSPSKRFGIYLNHNVKNCSHPCSALSEAMPQALHLARYIEHLARYIEHLARYPFPI